MEDPSRGAGGITERTEVTPLVRLVDGVSVIRFVGSVDDGHPMSSDHRGECFIEQCRIGGASAEVTSSRKKLFIDGGTQTYAGYATIVAFG
jgi:hypothetical protein